MTSLNRTLLYYVVGIIAAISLVLYIVHQPCARDFAYEGHVVATLINLHDAVVVPELERQLATSTLMR